MKITERELRRIVREALEVQHAGPSPLTYNRPGNVQRLSLVDSDIPEPKKWDAYFAQTKEPEWYGPTGRRLKKPKEKIVPGAAPGTVAFLDYDVTSNDYVFIHYMKTRNDMRGQGHARRLIDELVKIHGHKATYNFGKMLNPAIAKMHDDLKAKGINVLGHRDF